MREKVIPALGQLTRKSILLIIVLNAIADTLYICSLVIGANCNM